MVKYTDMAENMRAKALIELEDSTTEPFWDNSNPRLLPAKITSVPLDGRLPKPLVRLN